MVENDMMAEGRHQQERNPKGRLLPDTGTS
jgi:hypothetical protein